MAYKVHHLKVASFTEAHDLYLCICVHSCGKGVEGIELANVSNVSSNAQRCVTGIACSPPKAHREKRRWSTVVSFLSNHMWMLITGTPFRPFNFSK